ncbi:hypothetical protein LMANV2_560005 [Leptospira interrogans serovar Manilae]|uniref:Uncharacterized protein n=1 Tax=Leptospira interrogans serovar Manilae TaxID=214675 RepID=A0AAQ1P1P9_LEPIR|nr:hypothetical protein LMANV2_560005 [Leptospira interrogans serovar Manilae]
MPALAGIEVIVDGRLKTTQCHHPLPVGASGSYTVNAILLVSFGRPVQDREGEIFPPEHPKPLNTCSLAINLTDVNSGLFN